MYQISKTITFKKDFKRILSRNWDINKLETVLEMLITQKQLPVKYKLHPLQGNYKNHFDCHIANDWLLIFKVDHHSKLITLVRTGTHSDIFC